mgnify:CR=1 FL=1
MSDQLTEVYASIDALVDYALDHLDLDPRNADWTRNQIFALFHLDSYPGPKTTTSAASVSDAVQDIVGSRSQAPSDEKTPDPLLAAFRAAARAEGVAGEQKALVLQRTQPRRSRRPVPAHRAQGRRHGRHAMVLRLLCGQQLCQACPARPEPALRLARADCDHQPRQTRIQEHEEGGGRQRRGRRLPEVHDLP